MSEFSAGIMLNVAHQEIAKAYLEDNTYLIRLNDTWLCRLSDNDDYCQKEEDYSQAVLDMSVQIPLLHIMNAEDHGFWLAILHNKKIVFQFDVPYNIESEFAFSIGQELYGDEFFDLMFEEETQEKVQNEVQRRRHEADEFVESFFSRISEDGIAQFELFGFDKPTCVEIAKILTLSNYKKDGMGRQMMQEFSAALRLSEFCWVSHHYVSLGDQDFDIVG